MLLGLLFCRSFFPPTNSVLKLGVVSAAPVDNVTSDDTDDRQLVTKPPHLFVPSVYPPTNSVLKLGVASAAPIDTSPLTTRATRAPESLGGLEAGLNPFFFFPPLEICANRTPTWRTTGAKKKKTREPNYTG